MLLKIPKEHELADWVNNKIGQFTGLWATF